MRASPVVIEQDMSARTMAGVSGRKAFFDERWMQNLIFDNPGLLPCADIEPGFGRIVPLARELSVTSGAIDVLYGTPDGRLVIVETKLWRNPEAHRTVLAQIIDYAKDLARLEYDELDNRVIQSQKRLGLPALGLKAVLEGQRSRSIEFEDSLRAHLSAGRFLLLIVGDQIRPGVVMLADVLRGTPELEYRLGLVELRCYHLGEDDWPMVVVPEVVGRSTEVTRGVIRIRYEEKRPEVTVAGTDDVGTGKLDLETFLKSLPSELEDVYRPFLEKWSSAGPPFMVYWGTTGWSFRVQSGQRYHTVFDAYPDYISIFRQAWLSRWGAPDELYQPFYTRVSSVKGFVAIMSQGKRYVPHERMSAEEIMTVLSAFDWLAQSLAALNQ